LGIFLRSGPRNPTVETVGDNATLELANKYYRKQFGISSSIWPMNVKKEFLAIAGLTLATHM
jgi:hypothetical protein